MEDTGNQRGLALPEPSHDDDIAAARKSSRLDTPVTIHFAVRLRHHLADSDWFRDDDIQPFLLYFS